MSGRERVTAARIGLALLVLAATVALLRDQGSGAPRQVVLRPTPARQSAAPLTKAGPATTAAVARPPTTPVPSPSTSAPATTTSTTAPSATVTPTTAAAPVTTTASRQWAVGVVTIDLTDPSRSTPAAGSAPATAGRHLPTIVRYPVDGAASGGETTGAVPSRAAGPFPLIVFAHGYDSSPAVYAGLLHAWASAGYVVAAPSFPRGTAGGPLDEADLDQEPGDLSFVISQVLASPTLAPAIDPARIGVAGHSDGADAALGAGYDTCCMDHRIRADVVMAGDEHAYPGGRYFPSGSPPLLVTQADHDVFNPSPLGRQVYADARSPKYLLWLINATHLGPVTTDAPHLAVMEAATIGFFDQYLKGEASGTTRLRQAATPGLATLTSG